MAHMNEYPISIGLTPDEARAIGRKISGVPELRRVVGRLAVELQIPQSRPMHHPGQTKVEDFVDMIHDHIDEGTIRYGERDRGTDQGGD